MSGNISFENVDLAKIFLLSEENLITGKIVNMFKDCEKKNEEKEKAGTKLRGD